jgi:hypothetical protein
MLNPDSKTKSYTGACSDLWYLLLLAFLVLVTFSPFFLWKASLYDTDLRYVETLIKWFLFKEQSGKLWTERIGCGFPIHADGEGGLFYPVNWILYPMLSMPVAHDLNLMLHLFIAGAGAFLLGRRYFPCSAASAVTGVVFAFSGFMWVHMGHVNAIQACAWAPWAFLALDMEKDRPRLISGIALAFLISLMLLTRVQNCFYTVIALAMYAVWHGLHRPRSPRLLILLLLASLAAFCLAAAQVFPTLEFVMNSDRAEGLTYKDQLFGTVSWSQLLWLIAPVWQETHGQSVAAESIGYVGITTAFLMLISFLQRARKLTPWVLLLMISLLLSMGNDFPLNAFVYQIPGFSLFRCHARWLFVASLAAAILAGWGTNRLLLPIKDHLRGNLLGVLLVLLVFFDLSFCLRPLVHFIERNAQGSIPEAVSVLSGERYFVHDTPNLFVPEKEAKRYAPELLRRYFSISESLNANLGTQYGMSSVQIYAGLYPRWSSPAVQQPTLEDLRSMSCRYLVSRQTIQAEGITEIWRNPSFRIYLNNDSEPRARIASSIELDGNALTATNGSMAKILPEAREDQIKVSVYSVEAGFLVLADAYYPGWRALVNGREENILRVNGWMRAVGVPKGGSEVVFQYRPASFTWGIVVSGCSLILLVLILVRHRCFQSKK